MKTIEVEIERLEQKREYLERAWEEFHNKFFEDNEDVDPDRTLLGVSNSALTCWIIKHSLENDCIVTEDYWFILQAIQAQMKHNI